MNFSGKLFSLRTSREISQQALAEGIDFSFRAVQSWERGEACPGYHAIIALCRFFKISADELLELNEAQK